MTPRLAAHLGWVVLFGAVAMSLVCCNTDDTGNACGNPNASVPIAPITGEQPVVELVEINRDANCLTFTCLTHHGLNSYCSKSCSYNKLPKNPTACQTDSQCSGQEHCDPSGHCNDDDCPAGFWCETVQDVGSAAGQYYCTRQIGCLAAAGCGNVSEVNCVQLGCYGSCSTNSGSCAYNELTCEPLTTLGCTSGATCDPAGWESNAVTQEGVCFPLGQH